MYEFEALFDDAAFVVNFIIQLIILIVFFRMAVNIGQIKKHLTASSSWTQKKQAEKFIFKGQKEKAIDAYLDLLFITVNKGEGLLDENRKEIKQIINNIEGLGGTIPDSALKTIKKEVGEIN